MCSSQMTRAAVTLSSSLLVFSSMSLSCISTTFHFSSTIFLWSSTQTIESSRFSLTASSCPILPVTFSHVLRKEGKHKESKNGEGETKGDDDKHSPADVPRAVSVTQKSLSHKKHTIAAKPSQESSAKALSFVDSGPSTQTFSDAQKHANKRPPFQTLVTIHHCLHSFLLVTCFVLCHQITLTKTSREKKRTGNMRIKTGRWTEEKVIFAQSKFYLSNERSKEIRKRRRNNGIIKKGKERHLMPNFFTAKKNKTKVERRLDATDVPRPGSMTTECTQTWLTRLRHDTQQWSRGLSFAHAILNACESWNKFLFFQVRIFEETTNVNFSTLFGSKYLQKKVQKITFQKPTNLPKELFFLRSFFVWKTQKKRKTP